MKDNFAAYNRCYKAVDRLRSLMPPTRTTDIEIHLYVGEPGTGKSRAARDLFPDIFANPVGKDIWWDGYYGQRYVLIEDFNGEMRLVDLLRYTDRYPIQVPKKGGFVWWCPDVIIITTNYHPKGWYDYQTRKASEQALRRRFTHLWDFDNVDEEGTPRRLDHLQYWPIMNQMYTKELPLNK